MSSSFLASLNERTRELVSGILNETTISDKGKDYHLKTILSSEEYQCYIQDVKMQEPSFLSLIQDENKAEVVKELLKETWLDTEKRNGLVKSIVRDEAIYQAYLKEVGGEHQDDKEIFLRELDPVVRRMVEGMLEKNEIMKAEILVRSSGTSKAVDSFQRWKISKKREEKRVDSASKGVDSVSKPGTQNVTVSRHANRRNILILGERQVDTLYVVSAIMNYLETTTLGRKKVKSTNDYCECDNWHSYILKCEHEGKVEEICLIPLYDDFLQIDKHCHVSDYLQKLTIHGTILALGMNIPGANMEDGEDSKSESLVHCYYNIFKTFDMSECLSFFESSFASEQEKSPRRFWFVTNQLTNCRDLRTCETTAQKTYVFMKKDWESDAEELLRLFKEMGKLKPQVTKIEKMPVMSPISAPLTGEIGVTYERPFTVFKQ